MAQTTGGISFCPAYVEWNTTGTTWTSMGPWAASVAVSGGDRQIGEQFTFDGDTAILRGGKRGPIDVTVRFVYTETATDPFLDILDSYDDTCGGQLNIRFAPAGNTAGNYQYTTNTGTDMTQIVNLSYPQGEAGPGDVVMCEVTVRTSHLAEGTIAA